MFSMVILCKECYCSKDTCVIYLIIEKNYLLVLMCCFLNCYQQPVVKDLEEKAPKKPASKATEKKGKTVEVAK